MNDEEIVLSVLMISHNQAGMIERCANSIIAQRIPFPYEIIMSDDSSTDGTWEIVQGYAAKYPESVAEDGLYGPRVIATQMNSSDYDPANKSQRGGWNRSHACQEVHGKYMVVIDADDYYREGAHNLADQVAILERHPDCALCMENMYYLKNGDDFSKAWLFFSKDVFREGRIITAEEYIKRYFFMHAVAFMFRVKDNLLAQYGGRNVDTVIVSHFLQYGNIVCHDSADYVYIQDMSSTAHVMQKTKDLEVIWGLGIYLSALTPKLKHWYLLTKINEVQRVVSMCRHNYILEAASKKFLSGMGVYVYDAFNRKRTLWDKFRLRLSTFYIARMRKYKWTSKLSTSILYKLIIR